MTRDVPGKRRETRARKYRLARNDKQHRANGIVDVRARVLTRRRRRRKPAALFCFIEPKTTRAERRDRTKRGAGININVTFAL